MFKSRKDKSSTSAKTLGAGLFAAGGIAIHRALSNINLSKVQDNLEDGVSKQDLINLYNKIAQEENYNIYTNNLDRIKSRISAGDLLAEKFCQDGWDITSSDGSSLLTVAIEKIKEEKKKNRDCDIHVQIAASLILYMKKELIIRPENFADSNGKTLLHYLAELGKEDVLRFVIESSDFDIKEAVRSKDRSGKTPLHCAAEFGNKECFETLMENEAHFTSTINYKSELHYAAKSGNFSLLEYLEEILTARGIFEREKIKTDKYGNNALHYAAQSGNAECIELLVNNRVPFLKNQYNENPLHKIAGNSEIQDNAINFLIEHLRLLGRLKSEINREDADGNSPLHIAARYGNKQLIEVFIRLGAKFVKNKQDNTPLHIAIIHGNADCIEPFHKNIGNSIFESKGEHERSLIHLAVMYGQFNCLDSLIKKVPYCDFNTKTEEGNTALHLALSSNTETELRKKCVRLLIGRGVRVNDSNNEGSTPLHFVAQLIDLKFFSMIERELKKQRIDVHQEVLRENQSGNTAFHMAAHAGNKSCLEHLFSLVQEEEIEEILSKENNDGQTLLHLSMLSGSMECVKYLMQKSQIDIFLEQNTQKKLLFAAALSGNRECLEFLAESLVDRNMVDSIGVLFSHNDENNNTLLHMAALADGIGCSQYVIESVSKSIKPGSKDIFKANNYGFTPLHLATMSLNAEVIKYFMTDSCSYAEKALNIVSESRKTPLHYLAMSSNTFEKIMDDDFKQDHFLKSIALKKHKQNKHLREKAINILFYSTMGNKEKIINEKIDFDIKDNAGKTALDYALEHSDTSILRLFLDVFYEIKKNREKKYDKFKVDYQEQQKKILRFNGILAPMISIVIMICILSGQSRSPLKIFFTAISIVCCLISFLFASCSVVISYKKRSLKSDIKDYTEKIDRIEKVIGESVRTKVEAHNLEGYSIMLEQLTTHAEDILQLKDILGKFMHAVDLKSRDNLNIPSQGVSRRGSIVPCSLADRRNSSFLNDLSKKLSQHIKRNSKAQDTMERCDSASRLITIDEHLESKQKASQSKFKTAVTKLELRQEVSQSKSKTTVSRMVDIFRKKKNLVDLSSLSRRKNTKKEEESELIRQPANTNGYSIFSNPFSSSCSTSTREEFCTADRAARCVSYGSASKLLSMSEEGASKFPSATLSSPGAEIAVKEMDSWKLKCRPRVNSSPPFMSRRRISDKSQKSITFFDHIEKVRDSVFSTLSNPSSARGKFSITDYTDGKIVHHVSDNRLSSMSEEKAPHTSLSTPEAEIATKEVDFRKSECRPRVNSSPPCMSKKEIVGRIPSDHMERGEGIRIVATNPGSIDFDPDQNNDSKHSSELSLSSK